MADEHKKKKKGRWAHLDQFQKTLDGQYIYTGKVYRLSLSPAERTRSYVRITALTVALVVFAALGGCISAPGVGNCFYVLLPYVAALSAMGSLAWALAQLLTCGRELRAYVYEATVGRVPRRSILSMVFCGLACLGEVVYLLLHWGEGGVLRGVGFLALMALCAALALLLRHFVEALVWEETNGS